MAIAVKPTHLPSLLRLLGPLMLSSVLCHTAVARTVATGGCPLFHCTAAATGVESAPLIPGVLTTTVNASLGSLVRQGCSGNGTTLTCLYSADKAKGTLRGTLKSLNATTLQAIWGSAGASKSYNLDPSTAAVGQVPVNFTDGTIAAGDAYYEVLYNSSGVALGKIPLDGIGKNLGLTPISASFGIVSQSDGVLTLVNLGTWAAEGTLTLTDPATAAPIVLVAPSAAGSNVLYAIGYDSANNAGTLYSIGFTPRTQRMALRSQFGFLGSSGTCPVVVVPGVSGLPNDLILLAAPGLPGDAVPQNRLMALSDSSGAGLSVSWEIPLSFGLTVSPSVDQGSQSVFYQDSSGPNVYQSSLLTGAPLQVFNLQTLGGFPGTFVLNGHLGGSQAGAVFTLLLAGESTTAQSSAQYVMTFQPVASPGALGWFSEISTVPVVYTAAWNFSPSMYTGTVCPIVITDAGASSAIVRLCDH